LIPDTLFLLLSGWFWCWCWKWGWHWSWSGITLGNATTALLDKLDSMSSGTAVSALDSNGSLNGLGGRATATLLLHLTVLANGGTDALTAAHVDLKVSFSLAQHTVDLHRNSANKVGAHSATANTLLGWSVAFLHATVLGSVEVLFWALFEKNLSSREALGVDVSLTLLASALDTSVFAGSPGIANLSLLVVLVSTAEWHAHAAALARVGNSDVAHWAITAALSVTDWHIETLHIWSAWARASGTSVTNWTPELTWLVGLAFELTEIEWHASSLNMTWTTANNWSVKGSGTIWTVLEWWLNTADTLDGVWAARALSSSVSDWSRNVAVWTWQFIGGWAVGWIAHALVVITASWGSWVVGSDQDWRRAAVSTRGWSWNWAVVWIADAFLLVDWSAAVAKSLDVDLRSGDHLESSWAHSLLIVNWALANIAATSVLWAALSVALGQNATSAIASWSWWTEFWNLANMIIATAALMIVAIDVDSDWMLLDVASEFNSAILDDGRSAVVWVADTLELWTTISFSSAFLAVSTSGRNLDGNFLAGQAVGGFEGLQSFSTERGVAHASLATAARVSSLVESLMLVANWVDVVEWAGFDSALACSNWAAVVLIVSVKAQNFDLTKLAFGSGWSGWAVLGDVLGALDWLAPFLSAASSGISTNSLDLELSVAFNYFVVALDSLFDDQTWDVARAGSLDALVFLSTVVLVPVFASGMLNSALILANVTVSWVDTFGSLEDQAIWTEASLLHVVNHAPLLIEHVELVVFASLWYSWSASGPFFVSVASSFWALGIVVIAPDVVWHDVLVSPIVDTVSTVTATLLSKVVDLVTTGIVGNTEIEIALNVHAVERKLVIASVQEVVWIGDFSAIVEVWVDVDSVTFKGKLLFAFVAWLILSALKALWNLLTGVGWTATVS